ncbi:histone-lysine N-methyltransferase, H3 lysine-79 specific-like isoform X2 [Engraulis encrasicolus]|uniref:histone-lysine N-methyltransferase, H3 lysine-79 specific-like isoform X2 n=1 Tax=Engraulis encrasicolus TaxID=184585 RepID=UPI002FCF947E
MAATLLYKWTHDDTARLIAWRASNAAIFSGRRLSAIRGYQLFVKECGLEGIVSPTYVKKKWENLKQKYVSLKRTAQENGTDPAAESWRWYTNMEEALGGRIPEFKQSYNLKLPSVFISTAQNEMVHSLELTVDPQSPTPPPHPLPPPPDAPQHHNTSSLPPPPSKRQRTDTTDVMLEFLTKQEERDQQRDIEWMQREEMRENEALEREEQRESEAVEREERREREAIAREARREREAIEREGRREKEATEREGRRERETREREEAREREYREREERREREFQDRLDRMETVFREREDRLLSILEKLVNK